MKKLATAVAGAALVVVLGAPAGAATVNAARRDEQRGCSRHHEGRKCYDEHRPQHDGRGSLLF